MSDETSSTFPTSTGPTPSSGIMATDYLPMYIGVGTGAALTNVFILVVLFRYPSYLHKSAFIFGLATGNLFLGLAHLGAGIYRSKLAAIGAMQRPATQIQCMSVIVPTLFLLGTEVPAVLIIFLSFERMVAVALPTTYHQRWTARRGWWIVAISYIYSVCSIVAAWIITSYGTANVTSTCTIPETLGPGYTAYYYGMSIFCGAFGCIVTLIALCVGQYQLYKARGIGTNASRRIRRQLQLTRSMMTIACLDTGLVVVPNIFLYMSSVYGIPVPFTGGFASATYCCNSMLLLVVYLVFNSDFRRYTFKFLHIDSLLGVSDNAVLPNATTNAPGAGPVVSSELAAPWPSDRRSTSTRII